MRIKFLQRIVAIFVVSLLITSVANVDVALGKKDEKEDLDDIEWYEFLTTDIAKLSAPGSKNVYYSIINPQNGASGVRGSYKERLKHVMEDELKGYSMYDGLGLLDYKKASFYYNKPKSKTKHVGWVYYTYYHQPFWDIKTLNEQELNTKTIRFMLDGFRDYDLKTPVNFYKKKMGDREYNVLECEYKEKGKAYNGWYYYSDTNNHFLTHYFSKVYEAKSKYANTANEVFDQIITSAVLNEDPDEDLNLKFILFSARELTLILKSGKEYEKNKDDKKYKIKNQTIRVRYINTGAEENFDMRRKKLEDFAGKRRLIIAELDKLASKYPSNPKIYYALAVLSEYNDAGERYGGGFNEAKVFEYYKKAMEADSKFFYAYYNMAILYARRGKRIQAIECFKKCVDISPVDILSLFMLGRVYEDGGDYRNAYLYFWKAKNAFTHQEKTYSWKLYRKAKKRCIKLLNKKSVTKLKEEKNKTVARSTMALYFSINPEPLVRLLETNYNQMGDNLFSCFDEYILWHGYLRSVKDKTEVTAKWYSPDGKVFKEEEKVNGVKGDISSYYFFLNIAGTDAEKMPGVWKIGIYFKDSLIDTKYFYILDC